MYLYFAPLTADSNKRGIVGWGIQHVCSLYVIYVQTRRYGMFTNEMTILSETNKCGCKLHPAFFYWQSGMFDK